MVMETFNNIISLLVQSWLAYCAAFLILATMATIFVLCVYGFGFLAVVEFMKGMHQ
jgi:hypothetical protein